MKISQPIAGLCIAVLLSACGGGGSDGSSASDSTFPNAKKYTGTWVSACSPSSTSSDRDVLSMTESNGKLVASLANERFGNNTCAGTVLATVTTNVPTTLSYVGTVATRVVLSQLATPSSIQVDQLTVYLPQSFTTVTGAGVTREVTNGQVQWCFSYTGGSTCINDSGVQPAKTASGAIFTQDNQLFLMSLVNGVYVVDSLYTK